MFRSTTLLILLTVSTALFSCERKPSGEATKEGSAWSEGATPPSFELLGADGRQYNLSTFAGKVVLINFWATWCPPCVSEMGSFQRLYKLLQPEGLEILSINVDSRDALPEVKAFIADNGISFPVLLDPDMKTAGSWNLSGFPETFFIGRDGKLLELFDLEDRAKSARIIANRPWDAPEYLAEIRKLIQKPSR